MKTIGDEKTFYKLIKEQHSTNTQQTEFLTIEDQVIDDDTEILNAWSNYCEKLAERLQDKDFNEEYRQRFVIVNR